jgi:hypothetical protein
MFSKNHKVWELKTGRVGIWCGMMWETPVYKIKKDSGPEITIDVTRSAPNFTDPGSVLEAVFNSLTEGLKPEKTRILDVGAAKLRNTLYLLREGFHVYPVEFPELAQRTRQAQEILRKAEKFKSFKPLTFPKDFFKFQEQADIVLMINVVNVMPVPRERLVLLSIIREKIKKNGVVLWYNWKDDPKNLTSGNAVNDGFFKGKGHDNKTFHGEWDRAHVFEMFACAGFSHDKALDASLPSSSGNQVYTFRADAMSILDKYLDLKDVLRGQGQGNSPIIRPEERKIDFPSAYIEELGNTRSGPKEQTKFHRLAARLLTTIFEDELRNPVIEKEINEGRGRVDVAFQNKSEKGFFKDAEERWKIVCPLISVECKNYGVSGNPEFDQLSGRLSQKRGMLGLLVCRSMQDEKEAVRRCRDRLKDKNEYILLLDDNDLRALVKAKSSANDGTDDYMNDKLIQLVN